MLKINSRPMATSARPSFELVTPKIAEELLRGNTGNFRKPDHNRVKLYAASMARGEWDENCVPILFDCSGRLMDGQHRLMAVMVAGVDVPFLVVRGVSSSAKNIDRGKGRTICQWLSHEGVPNASLVGAIARGVVAHDSGVWAQPTWAMSFVRDNDVIECAMEHHEAMRASISSVRISGLQNSLLGVVMYVGSGRVGLNGNATARWFFDALVKGDEVTEVDAAYHLRNRLLTESKSRPTSPMVMRWLLTLAWNKTVAGEACTSSSLRVRQTGPAKEDPPNAISVAPAGALS